MALKSVLAEIRVAVFILEICHFKKSVELLFYPRIVSEYICSGTYSISFIRLWRTSHFMPLETASANEGADQLMS